jgi:hypothetical protein
MSAPAETARSQNADALGAFLDRALHALADGAAESDAPLDLLRDALSDELRVQVRLADLFDRDTHVLLREAAQVRLQALDVRAALPDDNAGRAVCSLTTTRLRCARSRCAESAGSLLRSRPVGRPCLALRVRRM